MKKMQLFIDGTWLHHIATHLREKKGYILDYGRLSKLVENHLPGDTKITEVHYFCSIREKSKEYENGRQKAFYARLEEKYGFIMHVYPAKYDKKIKSWKEKKVDMALGSTMQDRSNGQNAFDVGVILAGDSDFVPMLKTVKKRGKELLLVAYSEPNYYPTSRELLSGELFDHPVLNLSHHLNRLCYLPTKRA